MLMRELLCKRPARPSEHYTVDAEIDALHAVVFL